MSDKAKNHTFLPPVKITGGVGEIYGSSSTYDRTSGIHLLAGLAAGAENSRRLEKRKKKLISKA